MKKRILFLKACLCCLVFFLAAQFVNAQDFTHPAAGTSNFTVTGLHNYFDPGGAGCDITGGGAYPLLADGTAVLCPDVAGTPVTITFLEVDIETRTGACPSCCWDFLRVYNGDSSGSPILFEGCGEEGFDTCAGGTAGDGGDGGGTEGGPNDINASASMVPPNANNIFTSTDATGCLTVHFTSDSSVDEGGWVATVQLVVPEIDVTGNGMSISNGDVTPALADDTDFGMVDVPNSTSKTYTINNSGIGDLVLGANAVSTNNGDFVVTSQPAATIAPGGSSTFTIEFTPVGGGISSATVTINNNDGDESPYTFAIQGEGVVMPEIDVLGNGNSIANGDATPSATDGTDYGTITVGAGTLSQTFTINNDGTADLVLGANAVSTNNGDFVVTVQPAATIVPGGSSTFTIEFTPSAVGISSATVTIANDDMDESPYTFAIQGVGGDLVIVDNQNSEADGFGFADPCDCTDLLNQQDANDVYYFHDVLTITGTPGQNLTLASNDGAFLDAALVPYAVGTAIPETGTPGIYQIDFWHEQGVASNIEVTNGVINSAFTTTLCTSACGTGIPTMSEWGMIIFALIMLSFGVVYVMRQQVALAGVGTASTSFSNGMPFDKAIYKKVMAYVMIGLAATFAIAVAAFGYEMTNADLPGSLIAGPVFAYLTHLVIMSNKQED